MAAPSNPPFKAPPHILTLLNTLHHQSSTQESSISPAQIHDIKALYSSNPSSAKVQLDTLMQDKFIALDQDKCHFVHHLLIGMNAKTVVEVGTNFGVSTIYLALAVGRNGGDGKVIATEKESQKAERARGYWREAGEEVERVIELREGDLLETLREGVEDVDMVLLDIWPYVALPALKLLLPKLRRGAVVITDNVVQSSEGYKELREYLWADEGPFQNTILPYKGGLLMSVYVPQGT